MWESPPPALRSPVMVTAFRGWFDAGSSATGALEWLSERGQAVPLARVDPEELFNFGEQRPQARVVGGRRQIAWPDIGVQALPFPDAGRDMVTVTGAEPNLRWGAFVEAMVEAAEAVGAALMVTMGAQMAEVPHTRPLTVTGSSSDPELAAALGLSRPSYQGPTGVAGALQDRFARAGVPAASLRVSVPHYVSGTPNPKGSRALLERFERVTGLDTGWAELDEPARQWEEQVDQAMAGEEDVEKYVRRLESRADERAARQMPSPDDLAAELERYLRNRTDPGERPPD